MTRKARQAIADAGEALPNPKPRTKRRLAVKGRIWGPNKGFEARVNRKLVFAKTLEPLRRVASELGKPGIFVSYVG